MLAEGARRTARIAPLFALLLSGCMGVPYALPPAQLALGTGARGLDRDGAQSIDAPFQLRAAMHPLGFDRTLLDRPADFGLGYALDLNRHATLQAGYLEGCWHFAHGQVGDRVGRLGARLQARLLFDRGRVGPGVAAQLTAEWAGFSEETFSDDTADGGNFGFMFGENGVGLYLEGAWMQLGPTEGWTASAGVLLRIPAMVGFAWSWLD